MNAQSFFRFILNARIGSQHAKRTIPVCVHFTFGGSCVEFAFLMRLHCIARSTRNDDSSSVHESQADSPIARNSVQCDDLPSL